MLNTVLIGPTRGFLPANLPQASCAPCPQHWGMELRFHQFTVPTVHIQTGLEHLQGWTPKASRGSRSSGSPNFFLASHKQCEDARTAASRRSRARSCSAAPAGSARSRRRDRLMGVGRGHGTERCRPGYLARDTSSAL